MSNPAISSNPAFSGKTLTAEELNRIYNQPAADLQRPGVDQPAQQQAQPAAPIPPDAGSARPMTYENTISKTVLLFVIVLAFGAVGWIATPMFPALPIIAAVLGLVFGLVNAFKKQPSVPLILLYAVFQGVFLGGISMIFEAQWSGIVMQAVIGTLCVFGATLLLFRSGKVRTSPRMNKIFMIALVGYLAFSVVNVILMVTGINQDPWGMRSGWLGIAIGLLAVLLAAYSLVMDFEGIQNGVKNRVPEKWAWSAAFGLMVTLIWLYIEILRILAIFRN
ncbi:MAG: Bax inhibitor-1/YccA family protein [Candidatus Leucobacter sulfamidivorax]|nr:Bax inhibitor-1/YccA family protein [Candidatus Leucobacter sulfamidivorax]